MPRKAAREARISSGLNLNLSKDAHSFHIIPGCGSLPISATTGQRTFPQFITMKLGLNPTFFPGCSLEKNMFEAPSLPTEAINVSLCEVLPRPARLGEFITKTFQSIKFESLALTQDQILTFMDEYRDKFRYKVYNFFALIQDEEYFEEYFFVALLEFGYENPEREKYPIRRHYEPMVHIHTLQSALVWDTATALRFLVPQSALGS